MARAISSLPVPVSPKISTVESVGATRSTCASTVSRAGLSPMICSNFRPEQLSSLGVTLLTTSTITPEGAIQMPEQVNDPVLFARYPAAPDRQMRSEEHTSELQSRRDLVCR